MNKPIIGIVLDSANNGEKYSYSPKPWYALRKCYSEAVANFGGCPVMLTYDNDIDDILEFIDGLIIPGGDEDINPKFYGQEIASAKVKVNDERAAFELELAKKAANRNIPILGICNGMQVINVMMGGDLIQHIPDHPDYKNSSVNHEQPVPKDAPTHMIILKEGTIASSLAENTEIMVNSTHHQAVCKLGSGLIVSAQAKDGIIEAIESTKHDFMVGVQWHSEYLNTELDSNLFKKLIAEAKKVKSD